MSGVLLACCAVAHAIPAAAQSQAAAGGAANVQAAGTMTPANAANAPSATSGTIMVDARLRYEFGDREDLDDANAVTWRTRLGYETPAWRGLSALAEGQFNVTPDEDAFDPYPGAQGAAGKTLIADGPDVRLNRAAVQYRSTAFDVTGGRQRLVLDNARFVGDVGWRQNAQVFDAVMATAKPSKRLDVAYAYLGRAVRIFGSRADVPAQRRFELNTHVVHAAWRPRPALAMTGYTYIERVKNSPADSSSTYGGFVVAQRKVARAALAGRAEYARQTDNGASPAGAAPFDLNYVAVEGKAGFDVGKAGIGVVTPVLGFESLGGNGTRGFGTPLATLHTFNGWADVFLTTPPDGLHDLYLSSLVTLPHATNATVSFHRFTAARGDTTYGHELDLFVTKKINPWLTAAAKYAAYRGATTAPASVRPDLDRFTVQLDMLWTHRLAR
jgi:hypothetical protein